MANETHKKIGTTYGLNQACSNEARRAEQVYVRKAIASDSHPIQVDAWVGYGSLGRINLSKRQATELIGLLAQAVAD